MSESHSYSRPALVPPLGSARDCRTTDRGYPYDTPNCAPGLSNFAGLSGEAAGDTLAARLDTDMTALARRVNRLELTGMGQGEFPAHVIDAHWVRWNMEVGLEVEPAYTPQPGNYEYEYSADAPRLPWSTLAAERGPVRRVGPALHTDLIAATLATCGPDVLAAAIGAVQWCAGRLLRAGVDADDAMSAGRPGSWEAAAMRRVIDGGSAYVEPADVIARVGAILHQWVTGRYYAEVAENYAGAVSAAVYAIGLDTVDLYTIAEHCDPTDRHTGAAGWLTGLLDSYNITAPGAES